MIRIRLVFTCAILLFALSVAFGQVTSNSHLFENELACKSDPKAGKLLLDLRKKGFIDGAYVVEDSVSYFKLKKPLSVWNFSPVAVFGFELGYSHIFVRGPGTAPPEMVGIVVREDVASVKAKLQSLGIENLEVEEHRYDFKGNVRNSGSPLTQIACWRQN